MYKYIYIAGTNHFFPMVSRPLSGQPAPGVFRATTHSAPSKLMDGQLTLLRKTMRERRGSNRQAGLSPLPPSPSGIPNGG